MATLEWNERIHVGTTPAPFARATPSRMGKRLSHAVLDGLVAATEAFGRVAARSARFHGGHDASFQTDAAGGACRVADVVPPASRR